MALLSCWYHRSTRMRPQSWRFITLEVRVISHKKEALQPLSVPKNVAWNSLTFRGKVIDESVDRGDDSSVNQSIRLR